MTSTRSFVSVEDNVLRIAVSINDRGTSLSPNVIKQGAKALSPAGVEGVNAFVANRPSDFPRKR